MAETKTVPILSLFLLLAMIAAAEGADVILQSQPKAVVRRREKLSHLRIYWHDVVSGGKPTVVKVAEAATSNSSATGFGTMMMIDDPLTIGPDLSSRLVGRCQGLYASAAQGEFGLIMAMNFVFLEGKYNGSTIAVLGRNAILSVVREMPIVGGSGLFRFARGYVQARTHVFNTKSGDATVEYNVFVMHY